MPASVTALALRSPASSAGRPPCPSDATVTTARLLVGGGDGSIVAWPAGTAPTAPSPLLPCRRRRPAPAPATLTGHAGPVHALAAGPGGVVASGGADRTVRLWPGTAANADGGTILSGHQGAVWAVALAAGRVSGSLSTTLLLSGSADKTARVWALPADNGGGVHEAAAGSAKPPPPTRTLAGHHTDWVRSVDLGPAASPACCCACAAACPCGCAAPPTAALTGGDDGRAVVWDVEAGGGAAARVVRVMAVDGGPHRHPGVRAARFLSHHTFATGDAAGRVCVWDGRDGRAKPAIVSCGAHGGAVTSLVALPSPSSLLLASAGADGTVRAWDVRRGGGCCTAVADPGLGPLSAAAATPCGRGVVVGGPRSGRVGVVEVVEVGRRGAGWLGSAGGAATASRR